MFAFAAFVLGAVGQELWRGVRARRAMSRDSVPGGARRARAAQPAPLRRLHRARRDRGAVRRRRRVVGVPGASGWSSCGRARPSASAATRSATSARRRGWSRRATGGSSGSTSARELRVRARRRPVADARHVQVLLPLARTRRSGRCRASSRARRRPRSGCAPGCGATSGPRSRPTSAGCGRASTRATGSSPTPTGCRADAARRVPRRGAARADPLLRRRPAAGDVPASSPRRW